MLRRYILFLTMNLVSFGVYFNKSLNYKYNNNDDSRKKLLLVQFRAIMHIMHHLEHDVILPTENVKISAYCTK